MTPAEVAARAAAKHGVLLHSEAAAGIAQAVLDAHDTTYEVTEWAPKESWNTPEFQVYVRRSMRHRLLMEIADRGVLPVALPVESLRYMKDFWGTVVSGHSSGSEPGRAWVDSSRAGIPAELVEAGMVEWETVVVKLTVPVREATVGRRS